jgi:hypothetical protein
MRWKVGHTAPVEILTTPVSFDRLVVYNAIAGTKRDDEPTIEYPNAKIWFLVLPG